MPRVYFYLEGDVPLRDEKGSDTPRAESGFPLPCH
jgi:hypothetical protein